MNTTTIRKRTQRKPAPRRASAKQDRGERRRLAQLLISLCLFLLVFFGRGAFPIQLDQLNDLIRSDTNFTVLFHQLGQAVFNDEPITSREPMVSNSPETGEITFRSMFMGSRLGLEQTAQYGIRPVYTKAPAPTPRPVETSQPEAEPTPQVVTAVAQAYAADGAKLPSNVSFLYYELGLEKTVVPVIGEVSSGFGYRINPLNGKREFHLALDIAANKGTDIKAFADGVVEYIGESEEFGLYFKINHANGVSTFYAHCSRLLIRKGEKVTCGQTVALVGDTGKATGPHLHLTILKDNIRLDPAHYVDL